MLQPCTASAQAMSGSSTKSRTVQALMLCMLHGPASPAGTPGPTELYRYVNTSQLQAAWLTSWHVCRAL